jgi:hypothetical protein
MEQFIAVASFCQHHNVQKSFLQSLQEHGLVEIKSVEQQESITEEQLPLLEKIVRLHCDMDINIEGIETIVHLLSRVQSMQEQIRALQNRLTIYETEQ